MDALAGERQDRIFMGKCKMKLRIKIFALVSMLISGWGITSVADASAHTHSHEEEGLTAEAIDEMIDRLRRLKSRIPKGGVLKFSQEEALAWQMDEIKQSEDYKLMSLDEKRKLDAQFEKAKKELRQQIERNKKSSTHMQGSSSEGGKTKIKLVPKLKRHKEKRLKKKIPKKVIFANV